MRNVILGLLVCCFACVSSNTVVAIEYDPGLPSTRPLIDLDAVDTEDCVVTDNLDATCTVVCGNLGTIVDNCGVNAVSVDGVDPLSVDDVYAMLEDPRPIPSDDPNKPDDTEDSASVERFCGCTNGFFLVAILAGMCFMRFVSGRRSV